MHVRLSGLCQTLLVVTPMSARPGHDRSGMFQRLPAAAQATA